MALNSDTPHAPGAAVKDEAQHAWRDAKDAARSEADRQQRAAARGVDDFANALRQAARSTNDGQTTTARVAESVADSLERLSGTLRNRDLNTLVRDVEDFARSQPLVFFGAAVATGFLAMRFLKSGEPTTNVRDEQPGQWPIAEPTTDFAPASGNGGAPDRDY